MNRKRLIQGFGRSRESRKDALISDDGREPVGEQLFALFVEHIDEDKDLRRNPSLAEAHAFLHGCDGQLRDATVDKGARDFHGAMPVGVGLDDGHDA
jgi:hypothetical protein